ncbi:N-carbamoylsarcosine amidase, partial [Alcaligenes faecalis subsp. faecalis NCIB 8687]
MEVLVSTNEGAVYAQQGFGSTLEPQAPYGLLIIDLVNGFADPAVFGGGNIPEAIANTQKLLATAREQGWPVAHTRIVYADDGADHNIFSIKVPGMLGLTEDAHNSHIVPELAPAPARCGCCAHLRSDPRFLVRPWRRGSGSDFWTG